MMARHIVLRALALPPGLALARWANSREMARCWIPTRCRHSLGNIALRFAGGHCSPE